MPEPAASQIIAGKYRLESLIGHGGMGSVWRARHATLDMPVAVKFMAPQALADPESRQRFDREARALAALRTPHIVQVLDHGVDDDTPYIVMEYLEGEDLSERLAKRRRLALDETSHILAHVARALRRAHEAGITHRDLKPSNIYLARVDDEEVVKVLDFGVAKLGQAGALGDDGLTKTGTLLGSPGYMSPEQARGKEVDFRSDLWALAVIVFRCVTGAKPFAGDSIAELVIKLCIDPRPIPTRIAPDLPPAIDRFFERAFAATPEERFQSAVEMANAFATMVGVGAGGLEISRSGPSPLAGLSRSWLEGPPPAAGAPGSLPGSSGIQMPAAVPPPRATPPSARVSVPRPSPISMPSAPGAAELGALGAAVLSPPAGLPAVVSPVPLPGGPVHLPAPPVALVPAPPVVAGAAPADGGAANAPGSLTAPGVTAGASASAPAALAASGVTSPAVPGGATAEEGTNTQSAPTASRAASPPGSGSERRLPGRVVAPGPLAPRPLGRMPQEGTTVMPLPVPSPAPAAVPAPPMAAVAPPSPPSSGTAIAPLPPPPPTAGAPLPSPGTASAPLPPFGAGAAPSSPGVEVPPAKGSQPGLSFPLPPVPPPAVPKPGQMMSPAPPGREPTPTPASFAGFAPSGAEASAPPAPSPIATPLPDGALRPPPTGLPQAASAQPAVSPDVQAHQAHSERRLQTPTMPRMAAPPPLRPPGRPQIDVKVLIFAAAGAAILAIFFSLAIAGLRRRHTTASRAMDDVGEPSPSATEPAEPPSASTEPTDAPAASDDTPTDAPATTEPADAPSASDDTPTDAPAASDDTPADAPTAEPSASASAAPTTTSAPKPTHVTPWPTIVPPKPRPKPRPTSTTKSSPAPTSTKKRSGTR